MPVVPPAPEQAPPPAPAPPPQDALLEAVRRVIAATPAPLRPQKARRLLLKFHDDHTQDAELRRVFRGTVLYLTGVLAQNPS
jgi:hypothetical protein